MPSCCASRSRPWWRPSWPPGGAASGPVHGVAGPVEQYVATNRRPSSASSLSWCPSQRRGRPAETFAGTPRGCRPLTRRGLRAEVLETAGNPLVYGEMRVPGATRTLLLYATTTASRGRAPVEAAGPFTPILRDGRLEDGAGTARARTRERFEPTGASMPVGLR